MADPLYLHGWSAWAPGAETAEEWSEWARGERSLTASEDKPAIPHVDRMLKRRMSQLTRMTIQVGHAALEGRAPMKISFASVFGEVARQYRISERILETGEVSPADFSISVFNTPVAYLTVVDGITEGYVALYTGRDAFRQGLFQAAAALVSGTESHRLFIVADELLPDVYTEIYDGPNQPYAVAFVLSSEYRESAISIDPTEVFRRTTRHTDLPRALAFLKDTISV